MQYDTTEAKRLADAADKARDPDACYGGVKHHRLGKACPKCSARPDESCGYIGAEVAWLSASKSALAASLRDAVAERLREALREAADAMTCGPDKHGDNPAHYCPNCDNTSFNARANIRALLGGGHGHD